MLRGARSDILERLGHYLGLPRGSTPRISGNPALAQAILVCDWGRDHKLSGRKVTPDFESISAFTERTMDTEESRKEFEATLAARVSGSPYVVLLVDGVVVDVSNWDCVDGGRYWCEVYIFA